MIYHTLYVCKNVNVKAYTTQLT